MSQTIDSGTTTTVASGDILTVQRTLTVEGELEVSGLVTVNNKRDLEATAVDVDNATSTTTRKRLLTTIPKTVVESGDTKTITTPTTEGRVVVNGRLIVEDRLTLDRGFQDQDSASSTTTRERFLTAGRKIGVDSGDTKTIATATTEARAEVEGRLVVEDTLTLNGETNPAQDQDTSAAPLTRQRDLRVADAVDTDTATSVLQRQRFLDATGVDIDTAQSVATRVRFLTATATDEDEATTIFFPVSLKIDARAAIADILETFTVWPCENPRIEFSEDVPHKGKENYPDPAIYVATGGSDTVERFSADGDSLQERKTVSLDIWVLDSCNEQTPASIAEEYRRRVINILSAYMNDNFARTEFHNIEPVESTDFRQEHVARQTDHYIYTVEVETERLDTIL